VGRHGTTRVDQARESRGFTSCTMQVSSLLTMGVALDGCPVVAPILSAPPGACAQAIAYPPRRARAPACQRSKDTWHHGNA
jgi:hypothetical protein